MKEIGGYIEFEHYNMPILHENAIALNSGRNCLAYLIDAKKIDKIKIPLFLCDCIRDVCKKKGVQISYYNIDEHFMPNAVTVEDDEWLYVVNYYGQLSNEDIEMLSKKYKNIIVDQVQAYFQMPVDGIDTIYTCRKFFGVPDGAFLYTDTQIESELEIDVSFEKMHFLLGRFEKTASEFYGEYSDNEHLFYSDNVKCMSKLTKNLLHGINYEEVKKRRTDNFSFLHEKLESMNKLNLKMIEGAYMYPFYHEKAVQIRRELQKKKIYIPTLWPNVLEDVPENTLEYLYAKNILPLPCDQRYDIADMQYLVEEIETCIN